MQATTSTSAEAEQRIQKTLMSCQAMTLESIEVGARTLATLAEQEDKLNDVEDLTESTQSMISESLKTLRGMTWTGMFYNALTSIAPSSLVAANPPALPPAPQSSAPLARNSGNLQYDKQELFSNVPTRTDEDRLVDDLSRSVSELHNLSVTIGQALDASGNQIERIDAKTDRLTDDTLSASLKAAKILRTKGSRTNDEPAGLFQFYLPGASALLAVKGTNLVSTPTADRSCIFACFKRNGALVGIRSESTMMFLGCTLFGDIAVSADHFGSLEECYVDLTGAPSGLLFMSRNFSAGGWLKSDATGPGADGASILGATTTSTSDRTGAIIVQAIRLGDV